MQCFTHANQLPRTLTHYDYRAPPSSAYHERERFKPEPDKNGRMTNPDCFTIPLPFLQPNSLYEPTNPNHRQGKMKEMLKHINHVNFTTSRDAKTRPIRDRVHVDSLFVHSANMMTSTHSTYVNHGPRPVDRKHHSMIPAVGITPATYHVVPYSEERCITRNIDFSCKTFYY